MNFVQKMLPKKRKIQVLLLAVFLVFLFLRTYNMEGRNPFGWDQVDNAWAAKNILINHQFPLVGMQAKQNTGMFIGPLYYYAIAPFYLFTNLDPIASGFIALLSSIITFFVLFHITKQLFTIPVAFIAVAIYTISNYQITFDRIQWPVNFILPLSLIIFYALYKVITGNATYLLLLALAVGISLHIHFTSLFYFPIIAFALPFVSRKRETMKYLLLSLIVFFVAIFPLIAAWLTKSGASSSFAVFLQNNYHGFHLVRFFQLTHVSFFKYDSVLHISFLYNFTFIFVPIFFVFYLSKKRERNRLLLCYLIGLWFVVPWVLFALYSGELSDYYFSASLPLVYISLAYISWKLFTLNNLAKIPILLFWLFFIYTNTTEFIHAQEPGSLAVRREHVREAIATGEGVKFQQGVPEAYLYYLYLRKMGKNEVIRTYFD